MKGNIQIFVPVLTALAVMSLLIAILSLQGQFNVNIASSQEENLDSYQSKLYMHTVVQNRTLIDKIGNYTGTGNKEAKNRTRDGLTNILGGNTSSYSYRASVKEYNTLESGEYTFEISNNNERLEYSRILVPSPKTRLYELELGSKVQ